MADKIELNLQDRTVEGRAVKKLRLSGYIPGVIYGQGVEAKSVMGEEVPMIKAYKAVGKSHPVELIIGKQKHLAMIKTADFDPAKHKLRHLAFHVIKQNEKVETEVPIVIVGLGETPAEKAGLIVLTTIDKVQIAALPKNLPQGLEVDGNKFEAVGDHATVADLTAPHGVTVLSDLDQVVATVYEPSALQAANEAAGGEAEEETIETEEAAEAKEESKVETEKAEK